MASNDLDQPDDRSGSQRSGPSRTSGTSLGDRLHRNLHGLIVATVLTLVAVAVLVSHYAF